MSAWIAPSNSASGAGGCPCCSGGGGEHWAVIASLVETCKLIGIEPQAYLADVITRIVEGHRQQHLDDLLPWAYQSTPALKAVA